MATSIKGMTVREFEALMRKEHPEWYSNQESSEASAKCSPAQKKDSETRTVTFTFIPDEKKFWEERRARAEARKALSKTNKGYNQ